MNAGVWHEFSDLKGMREPTSLPGVRPWQQSGFERIAFIHHA